MLFKKYKGIATITLVFLFIKLITLNFYKIVWWDSAVYIGMGKYIYSLGNAGLWENSRPIVWPLILGFFWKLGFNVILVGRIMEVIFGGLCILMTYLIGRRLFNEKTAMLSSLLLAISPTFFFFGGVMLTEIISTFFALSGIYYFIERKHLLSGLFLGIAFMTRFLQLIVFIALVIVILIYFNKKDIKNQSKIFIGLLIAVLPYLALNLVLYNNAFLAFAQQLYLSNNSGWFNYHSLNYYLIELFKENFLYLLFVFGIFLLFKGKGINKKIIVISFYLFFIFFNSIKQKEMRFLIISFPYLYLLVSYFVVTIYDKFKNQFKYAILIIILLSFVFSFIKINSYYKEEISKHDVYKELQNRFQEQNVRGDTWVSNPIIPVKTDKLVKLIYYPTFNETKKGELIKEKSSFIFLDFCDLGCRPGDINCSTNKVELLNFLKNELKVEYSSIMNDCEQYIFKR